MRPQREAAPGAADAGFGIDDDIRLDQTGREGWQQGKNGSCRITAGIGHQRAFRNTVAVPLAQPVDGGFQQGRRGMTMLIPLLVFSGVTQAEISREVYY